MTEFANQAAFRARYNESEVYAVDENKAFPKTPTGTKVTIRFGPASAIIMSDCVIP
jgi:hypothetical protein